MYERYLRPDELMHYGVIGMKWGVRRYQNPDGSLTPAGARRLGRLNMKQTKNREKYDKAKRKYDIANTTNTWSPFASRRRKKEERRSRDMSKYSQAMSELDIKNRRLERKKQRLTGHTNKSIEGINLDQSTKSARKTQRSLNYLEKQRAKNQANANTLLKKSQIASTKGNDAKAKKYADRGKAYLRNVKEIDNLSNTVMKLSGSKGQYTIGSKYNKYVASGRDIIALALGGPIAGTVSRQASSERNVEAMRYRTTTSREKAKEYERQAIEAASKRNKRP